ncbi:hypothetical protein GCM10010195_18680 [Kitasatospora griseola]|nr:hypothetical protein GCM10010195_18680 [Kitasatospora griseola]
MRVVDGHREAAAQGADGVGPGGVPGSAELDPLTVGPPLLGPSGVVRVERCAEPFAAVGGDLDVPQPPVLVAFGEVQRHVVEPLVGEQQAGDAGRQVGAPVDPGGQAGGTVGEFDGVERDPGAQFGGQCVTDGDGEFAAARADVHEGEPGRRAERGVDAGQQAGHRAGEPGGGVHGGAEVPGRALRPAVEAAVGPVQRVFDRGPPPHPCHSGGRYREGAVSTLGSSRGSLLRRT